MSLYIMLAPGNYDEAVCDALENGEVLSIIFGEQTLELSARAFYGILVMLQDRKSSYEQRYQTAIGEFVKGKSIKLDSYRTEVIIQFAMAGWTLTLDQEKYKLLMGMYIGPQGNPEWVDHDGSVRIRRVYK